MCYQPTDQKTYIDRKDWRTNKAEGIVYKDACTGLKRGIAHRKMYLKSVSLLKGKNGRKSRPHAARQDTTMQASTQAPLVGRD